jgi:Ca2+-binding RTX toxin-like protein
MGVAWIDIVAARGLDFAVRRTGEGVFMKRSAVCLALVLFVPIVASVPASADEDARSLSDVLGRRESAVPLASGLLREAVTAMERGQAVPRGVDRVGSSIRVEVLLEGNAGPVIAEILAAGGAIEGRVPGELVQALVPFDRLVELERFPGVGVLRPPLAAVAPQGEVAAISSTLAALQGGIVGQEVAKTNADDWHAQGWTGAGVKVGIIDAFDGALWSAAQAAGEVPAPAGTFCRVNGASCDVFAGGSSHGEGVAEIVHEMAPGAQIYIAQAGTGLHPGTASDLQAAVNYFASQGVDIITKSSTAEYDGPGDGTGPIASVIDSAVAQGMTWFNSVGNSANAYWRGPWQDANGNSWLDWSAAGDEIMAFDCHFVNGLRWSDWGSGRTDYDLVIADTEANAVAGIWKAVSVDDQTIGAAPLEHVSLNCGTNDIDYAAVFLFAPGTGTGGDVIEFMTNGFDVEYGTSAYSATGPAADTKSPGGLAIGAVDPPNGTAIADYSARGPTNDGRIKPDMSAAACLSGFTFRSPDCFNGSSAATPVAAGAAALVLQSGQATTPATLKTYLLTQASVDRGASGPDNTFGSGELILPAPGGGGGGTCTFPDYGGSSVIVGSSDDDELIGTNGADLICSLGGDDLIVGGGGNDVLLGGKGDDILEGSGGRDYLDGQRGFDFISYVEANQGIRLSYVTNKARGDGKDVFFGLEGFLGSPRDDDVEGSNGENILWGNDGDDVLRGFGGNDTIEGADGDDFLYGGQGNDEIEGQRGFDFCDGGEGSNDSLASCEVRIFRQVV